MCGVAAYHTAGLPWLSPRLSSHPPGLHSQAPPSECESHPRVHPVSAFTFRCGSFNLQVIINYHQEGL